MNKKVIHKHRIVEEKTKQLMKNMKQTWKIMNILDIKKNKNFKIPKYICTFAIISNQERTFYTFKIVQIRLIHFMFDSYDISYLYCLESIGIGNFERSSHTKWLLTKTTSIKKIFELENNFLTIGKHIKECYLSVGCIFPNISGKIKPLCHFPIP